MSGYSKGVGGRSVDISPFYRGSAPREREMRHLWVGAHLVTSLQAVTLMSPLFSRRRRKSGNRTQHAFVLSPSIFLNESVPFFVSVIRKQHFTFHSNVFGISYVEDDLFFFHSKAMKNRNCLKRYDRYISSTANMGHLLNQLQFYSKKSMHEPGELPSRRGDKQSIEQ